MISAKPRVFLLSFAQLFPNCSFSNMYIRYVRKFVTENLSIYATGPIEIFKRNLSFYCSPFPLVSSLRLSSLCLIKTESDYWTVFALYSWIHCCNRFSLQINPTLMDFVILATNVDKINTFIVGGTVIEKFFSSRNGLTILVHVSSRSFQLESSYIKRGFFYVAHYKRKEIYISTRQACCSVSV